jgi:hypothetical protein
MKKFVQKVYQKRLGILSVVSFVFPVLPLILLSVWALFMMLAGFISYSQASINISGLIWRGVISIWLFGGLAGLFGAVFALFKIYTNKTFYLFVYGAACYSTIAVAYIVASLNELSIGRFLFAMYLLMTLVVIAIQIVRLYEKLQRA